MHDVIFSAFRHFRSVVNKFYCRYLVFQYNHGFSGTTTESTMILG